MCVSVYVCMVMFFAPHVVVSATINSRSGSNCASSGNRTWNVCMCLCMYGCILVCECMHAFHQLEAEIGMYVCMYV
jgi:hypothetical protein